MARIIKTNSYILYSFYSLFNSLTSWIKFQNQKSLKCLSIHPLNSYQKFVLRSRNSLLHPVDIPSVHCLHGQTRLKGSKFSFESQNPFSNIFSCRRLCFPEITNRFTFFPIPNTTTFRGTIWDSCSLRTLFQNSKNSEHYISTSLSLPNKNIYSEPQTPVWWVHLKFHAPAPRGSNKIPSFPCTSRTTFGR